MGVLKVWGLTKRYAAKKSSVLALRDVSFTFENGLYALLGPNGSGKSTFMNIITGSLQKTAGYVLWNGFDIAKSKNKFHEILGYMPQQQGLYSGFSGYNFLEYFCALKNIPPNKMTVEIQRVAAAVNLEDRLGSKIASYSGGMKQRLLAAQALLGDPKLLIFDEPTAGLDPKERYRMRAMLSAEAKKGKIVIIATHVVSDVETTADIFIFLKNGVIADSGSHCELAKKYQTSDIEQIYMRIFGEDAE